MKSKSYHELKRISTEQLVKEHDKKAKNTVVGTSYYLDELNRRAMNKRENTLLVISAITLLVATISLIISMTNGGAN